MKVLSVAGYSHTGKTTTVVNILRELKKRGYSVSSIKDIHYEKFTMEKVNSNTWKHWEASENTVIARGLQETYQIWHKQLKLSEIISFLDTDWVVIEGMKSAAVPRIVCSENIQQIDELNDNCVFAHSGKIASDISEYKNKPVINSINNIDKLVDLIEEKVFNVLPLADPECCSACGFDCYTMCGNILQGINKRNDCITESKRIVSLKIDNKEIPMVGFVQKIFYDLITAFIKNLKGVKKGKINITIE